MMFEVVFRRAAAVDFENAARWYELRAPRIEYRFVESVEQAVAIIAEAPHRPATILSKVRRVRTRGFPFFVYYIVEDARIVILAVLHARRNPKAWRGRT